MDHRINEDPDHFGIGKGKRRKRKRREREEIEKEMIGYCRLIECELTAHGVVLQTLSVMSEIRGQDPATPGVFVLIVIE